MVEAELAGRLDESYDRAKVSGPPLVGLRLGSAEGNLEPDSLIVVRPDLQDFTICVRTTTQDGRYSSSAPYRITSDRPEAGYVRLSPVTIEYESKIGRAACREREGL